MDVPKPRVTTPEIDQQIADLYAAGAKTGELAERFAINKVQIARIVRRMGGTVRPKGPNRLTAEQETELAAMYVAGASVAEMVERFGIEKSTVPEIARRHGLTLRPAHAPQRKFTEAEVDKMVAMWDDGFSQSAIAEAYETTQVAVSRKLMSRNVEPSYRFDSRRRERSNFWKGGRVMLNGYPGVMVAPDDPMASMRQSTGYVLEHRLVMARKLGRPLERTETVHHINGDEMDNRPENLQLRQGRHGKGVVLTCRQCGSHDIEASEIDD